MEQVKTSETENSKSKVVAILDICHLVWAKKWFVLIFCSSIIALTAIFIFSLPRTFESETILVPEVASPTAGGNLSGGLGSLASLAGVKLGGSTEDALYPELYPKIISSSEFLTSLFNIQVQPKGKNVKVFLYDYLTFLQEKPWWGGIIKDKKQPLPLSRQTINPDRLTKEQEDVTKAINKSIVCMVDKKTDIITIDVTLQDPEIATTVANEVKTRLQKYITEYRTNKAQHDLQYAQQIMEETGRKYRQSQRQYALYSDANQDVVLSTYRQEEDRLENEMQLAFNAYSQATTQVQLAQAKLQERTPAFTTIQPATVPLKPNGPKRMITVILMSILSFFMAVSWILLKDSYRKSKTTKSIANSSEDEENSME